MLPIELMQAAFSNNRKTKDAPDCFHSIAGSHHEPLTHHHEAHVPDTDSFLHDASNQPEIPAIFGTAPAAFLFGHAQRIWHAY